MDASAFSGATLVGIIQYSNWIRLQSWGTDVVRFYFPRFPDVNKAVSGIIQRNGFIRFFITIILRKRSFDVLF